MEDVLKKYVEALSPLSDGDFLMIYERMRERFVAKKQLLVREGEHCSKFYFYSEGCFRFYYTDHAGREITSDFSFAPGFITSYTSVITGQSSIINVQAMTDSLVLELDRSDLYDLYNQNKNIERIGRIIAERTLIAYEEHLFMVLNQPAELRYKTLLEKYPKYIREIPLQYIASYLGITQETLSRIRRLV